MNLRAAFAVLGGTLVAAAVFGAAPTARAAATVTWTGGDAASNLWSDPDNWNTGVPVAGDLLVFPQAAARKANVNDLAANTLFESITFTGSGYSIDGNDLGVDTELRNQPSNGTNTVELDVGGEGDIVNVSGRLVLQGDNVFEGQVLIEGGRLVAGSDNSLAPAFSFTSVSAGATLVVGNSVDLGNEPIAIAGDGDDGLGALQSPAGTNVVSSVQLVEDATIGVFNSTLVVGSLLGSDDFALVGGGKLQIEGALFAGDVDVIEGNLTWNASSQAFVDVEMDGWLRGTGMVSSATVSGGLIWPGSGSQPGILSVAGATTFLGGFFQVDLDGPASGTQYGQLSTGSLTLSPVSTLLDIDLTFTPAIGQVFTIIEVASGSVGGSFLGLPEGATFTAEGFAWRISYKGGDGNDVTITVLRAVTADLELDMTAAPSPVAAGGLLTYTIVVRNEGPDTASSPTVTMGTPVGTTFQSATGPANWVCSKPTNSVSVSCTGPALPSGSSATFTFVFRVNQGATGPLSGTAAVSSATNDPFSADNAETVLTPVGPGGTLGFRLVVPGIARD